METGEMDGLYSVTNRMRATFQVVCFSVFSDQNGIIFLGSPLQ